MTAECPSESRAASVSSAVAAALGGDLLEMGYDKEPCSGAWDKIQKVVADSKDETFKVFIWIAYPQIVLSLILRLLLFFEEKREGGPADDGGVPGQVLSGPGT